MGLTLLITISKKREALCRAGYQYIPLLQYFKMPKNHFVLCREIFTDQGVFCFFCRLVSTIPKKQLGMLSPTLATT